jgi:hypothetical protein
MKGLFFALTALLCLSACESGLRRPITAAAAAETKPVSEPVPEVKSAMAPPRDPPPVTPTRDETPRRTIVPVANAEKEIARLRPYFRACYNAGLACDPTMEGRVVLTVHIESEGAVGSVAVTQHEGLDEKVIECLATTLRGAHFDAPGGQGSTLNVPIVFRQNRPKPAPAKIDL